MSPVNSLTTTPQQPSFSENFWVTSAASAFIGATYLTKNVEKQQQKTKNTRKSKEQIKGIKTKNSVHYFEISDVQHSVSHVQQQLPRYGQQRDVGLTSTSGSADKHVVAAVVGAIEHHTLHLVELF
jgi:hypothetical protein